jgi:hypothetical protein
MRVRREERGSQMKRHQFVAIGALLGVALTCGLGLYGPGVASGQAELQPPQWAYKVLVVTTPRVEPDLNRLGTDGWELITVVPPGPNEQGFTMHFKRPKR